MFLWCKPFSLELNTVHRYVALLGRIEVYVATRIQ